MQKNPAFEKVVLSNFGDLADEFKFEIDLGTTCNFDKIEFINDKCILRFIYDMGAVECHFINPVEKAQKEKIIRKDGIPTGYPVYAAYGVWRLLYPNDTINFFSGGTTWGSIEDQIIEIKKMIVSRLLNVVNGDFSWVGKLKGNLPA